MNYAHYLLFRNAKKAASRIVRMIWMDGVNGVSTIFLRVHAQVLVVRLEVLSNSVLDMGIIDIEISRKLFNSTRAFSIFARASVKVYACTAN